MNAWALLLARRYRRTVSWGRKRCLRSLACLGYLQGLVVTIQRVLGKAFAVAASVCSFTVRKFVCFHGLPHGVLVVARC